MDMVYAQQSKENQDPQFQVDMRSHSVAPSIPFTEAPASSQAGWKENGCPLSVLPTESTASLGGWTDGGCTSVPSSRPTTCGSVPSWSDASNSPYSNLAQELQSMEYFGAVPPTPVTVPPNPVRCILESNKASLLTASLLYCCYDINGSSYRSIYLFPRHS